MVVSFEQRAKTIAMRCGFQKIYISVRYDTDGKEHTSRHPSYTPTYIYL